MSEQAVTLEKREGIATLTMNRPEKLNAMDETLFTQLAEAIKKVDSDPEVKVVVITGAGRAFSAGADLDFLRRLSEMSLAEAEELLYRFERDVILALRQMPKPVIAAVNGAATGAGLGVVMASDIVIASENAKFGTAYLRIGLAGGFGYSYFLPRLMGYHKAFEIVLLPEVFSANEAEKLGLVNRVVPKEKLMETVYEIAKRLAEGPLKAQALAKINLNVGLNMDLEGALANEARGLALTAHTKDHREGLRAFREKRKPMFRGK